MEIERVGNTVLVKDTSGDVRMMFGDSMAFAMEGVEEKYKPKLQKIILTKGLPASGKSTWAKMQMEKYPDKYKRINKDDLRSMLDAGKWSKGNEKFILKMRDFLVIEALGQGYSVIVDDTNLHPKHEARMREIAEGRNKDFGENIKVEIKDFTEVPIEVCIERDRIRPNSVGAKVIKQMYRQFLRTETKESGVNPEGRNAIISDLDGTLALLNGRSPYDASTCENDILNEAVYSTLLALLTFHKVPLIIVSGREDTYKPETERWLLKNGIKPELLLMRKAKDYRQDAVIKKEIYETEIKPKFNVRLVLDDRDQVVEMWRDLGLPCFQVADGDF